MPDPRRQTAAKQSLALAWADRFRSDVVGTSPPAICLAEHRVEFGVGPELPYLLRTAAGDRDLCGPPEGSLLCGHVDDGEASTQLLGLRVCAVGDRPVGGHDARPLEFQSR